MKLKYCPLFIVVLLLLGGNVIAQSDSAGAATSGGKTLNLGTILFIAGFIVFLIVVRKLYDAKNKRAAAKEEAANPKKKDNIYEPRYWYQCKNCKVTVRKDSPPHTADCFQAVDHNWTQLAEVGTVKYLCRNCSTMIEARTVPVPENCPDAPVHDWERLS